MYRIQDDIVLLQQFIKDGLRIHGSQILRMDRDYPGLKIYCQTCTEEIDPFKLDGSYFRLVKSCGKTDCKAIDKVTPVVKALIKMNTLKAGEAKITKEFPEIGKFFRARNEYTDEIYALKKSLNQARRVESELRQELNKDKTEKCIGESWTDLFMSLWKKK